MNQPSVHTILKHIEQPTCIWCGQGQQDSQSLVYHIASCKVLSVWTKDHDELKAEIARLDDRIKSMSKELEQERLKVQELKGVIKSMSETEDEVTE